MMFPSRLTSLKRWLNYCVLTPELPKGTDFCGRTSPKDEAFVSLGTHFGSLVLAEQRKLTF